MVMFVSNATLGSPRTFSSYQSRVLSIICDVLGYKSEVNTIADQNGMPVCAVCLCQHSFSLLQRPASHPRITTRSSTPHVSFVSHLRTMYGKRSPL
jgi:hypothetical protein